MSSVSCDTAPALADTESAHRDRRYRWIILAITFVTQMLAIGSTSYGFALFVKPVSAEYGLSRADVNLGMILLIAGNAVFSPIVGRALDRFPARMIVMAGGILFGLASWAISLTHDFHLIALAIFLPLACGAVTLGPITASTLIARWFDERRGQALGISAVASSTGGMLVIPVMAWLMQRHGWRETISITGTGIMLTVLVIAFFLRERRSAPASSQQPGQDQTLERWAIGKLARTRDFWLLTATVGILFSTSQSLLSSLVAYGSDRGFAPTQAAMLLSAVSLSSIVGKLLLGAMADRIDKRLLLSGVALLLGVFVVILLLHPAFPVLIAGCLVAGAAIGGSLPLWGAIISSRFGVGSFGAVMGWTAQMQLPLQLGALRFIGESYDRTGGYDLAFAVFAALAPVAMLTAWLIGRPSFAKL